MIYCLGCRKLLPARSKFCAYCQRSFGGRLCKRGHRSPVSAKCCTECGSKELSKPVGSLGLSCLVQVAASALALTCLKVGLDNLGWIALQVVRVLGAIGSFVLGESPLALAAFVIAVAIKVVILVFILCPFMRPAQRQTLLKLGGRVFEKLLRELWNFIKLGAALLVRSVYGKPIRREEKR